MLFLTYTTFQVYSVDGSPLISSSAKDVAKNVTLNYLHA